MKCHWHCPSCGRPVVSVLQSVASHNGIPQYLVNQVPDSLPIEENLYCNIEITRERGDPDLPRTCYDSVAWWKLVDEVEFKRKNPGATATSKALIDNKNAFMEALMEEDV